MTFQEEYKKFFSLYFGKALINTFFYIYIYTHWEAHAKAFSFQTRSIYRKLTFSLIATCHSSSGSKFHIMRLDMK